MEIRPPLRRLNHADTNDKVAEPLTLIPLHRVPLEQWLHDLENLLLLDTAAVELVQPLAMVATAQVHVVSLSLIHI